MGFSKQEYWSGLSFPSPGDGPDPGIKLTSLASWQESYDKLRQCVEKLKHYSADKGPYSQGYGLPSGHLRL